MAEPINTEFGARICKALNLEHVTDIKIHVPMEGVVTVAVTKFLTSAEAVLLATVIEDYELAKRKHKPTRLPG